MNNKPIDDSQRKEAMRYLSKNAHGSRRSSKLLGALTGPPAEGPSNKKRKKVDSIPCKKSLSRGDRKKSHSSVMCVSR